MTTRHELVIAGGAWKLISGMPCALIASSGALSNCSIAARSPLATASATGGRLASTALTANPARPS